MKDQRNCSFLLSIAGINNHTGTEMTGKYNIRVKFDYFLR